MRAPPSSSMASRRPAADLGGVERGQQSQGLLLGSTRALEQQAERSVALERTCGLGGTSPRPRALLPREAATAARPVRSGAVSTAGSAFPPGSRPSSGPSPGARRSRRRRARACRRERAASARPGRRRAARAARRRRPCPSRCTGRGRAGAASTPSFIRRSVPGRRMASTSSVFARAASVTRPAERLLAGRAGAQHHAPPGPGRRAWTATARFRPPAPLRGSAASPGVRARGPAGAGRTRRSARPVDPGARWFRSRKRPRERRRGRMRRRGSTSVAVTV